MKSGWLLKNLMNSDSNSNVFYKRFANRSIENSKAWFSYGSFKIRHFWEYHSSGGICGWNGRLYALSGCEIDLFLCLDVIEINDFISVKMRNRNCVSGCEWNSCQDVKIYIVWCDWMKWKMKRTVRMRNEYGTLRCR